MERSILTARYFALDHTAFLRQLFQLLSHLDRRTCDTTNWFSQQFVFFTDVFWTSRQTRVVETFTRTKELCSRLTLIWGNRLIADVNQIDAQCQHHMAWESVRRTSKYLFNPANSWCFLVPIKCPVTHFFHYLTEGKRGDSANIKAQLYMSVL